MRRVIEKDRKQPVPDKEPSGRLQDMGVSWPCSDVSPRPLGAEGNEPPWRKQTAKKGFFYPFLEPADSR